MTDDFLVVAPQEDPLSKFLEKDLPWERRAAMIHEQFKSVNALDWEKLFDVDPIIMGNLINDIIKKDASVRDKPTRGKRPAVDPKKARERFNQISGDDYSILPFNEALKHLAVNDTVRSLAKETGIGKYVVHQLLRGEREATVSEMEAIARYYEKDPSYFLEYRTTYILGVLWAKLMESGETSIVHYRKLRGLSE